MPQETATAAERAIITLKELYTKLYLANAPEGRCTPEEVYDHRMRHWHGYADLPADASPVQIAEAKCKAVDAGKGILQLLETKIINGVLPAVMAEAEQCRMSETGKRVREAAKSWARKGYGMLYPSDRNLWSIPVPESQLDEQLQQFWPIHDDLLAVAAAHKAVYAAVPSEGTTSIVAGESEPGQLDGAFSPAQLAAKYQTGLEATRNVLNRWRKKNAGGDGFIENTDRRSTEPQFMYSPKHVAAVMEALQRRTARRTKTTGIRPAR